MAAGKRFGFKGDGSDEDRKAQLIGEAFRAVRGALEFANDAVSGRDIGPARKQVAIRDDDVVTVHVPMAFRKRGGRKMVVMPDGAPWASRPSVDNAIVKALARAFRWQRMLDDGVCGTIKELAERERVNAGYMSRVLRLTLLAPDIVEAILDGRQPEEMRLEALLEGFPVEWDGQRKSLAINDLSVR